MKCELIGGRSPRHLNYFLKPIMLFFSNYAFEKFSKKLCINL